MFSKAKISFLVTMLFIGGLAQAGAAQTDQAKQGDGTITQRLEVMRDKLERIRKSISSAITTLRAESTKDNKGQKEDEKNLNSPLGRFVSLDKDAGRLQSDVNSIRSKVDRAEKYDKKEVDSLEQAVNELQGSVDTAQLETASARAQTTSPEGQPREKKKKGKFLGIFGKGGNDEYEDLIGSVSPGRDRELFIVATREIRKAHYDIGRLLFQTIITTYPDSPYLPMSKLAVGDSFFLEGSTSSLIQAIASYQDWLTFFPTHPLADRVVLKIAEAEMRQVGLPDRDATRAHRAETRLKALIQQYPNSSLKDAAESRLKQVQDNLGLHDLGIADYYYTQSVEYKKGGLKGAQSRFREVVDKYPNFCNMEEVLYKLANTYLVEEETDQAARYFQRIVTDYPNGEYVAKAKEQLGLIGATIPPPDPARLNVEPCGKPSFLTNFKNEFFGIYPMTIDKDGVLMTKEFDNDKFEMIDQIIANQGDILANQIPQALTTVISQKAPVPTAPKPTPTPQNPPKQ